MRVAGFEDVNSIEKSENLADVLFADDKYAPLIQLTDVISGLRKVAETARINEEDPQSDYKMESLQISKRLKPVIEYENVIRIQFTGESAA